MDSDARGLGRDIREKKMLHNSHQTNMSSMHIYL